MPELANSRHELYARHRARGMVAAKAAVAAGFATGSSIYSKLEADPDIMQRVSELMEEIKDKREQQRVAAVESAKKVGQLTGVARSWVVEQLAQNALQARNDGDYKSSNEALKMLGDEFGMFKGGSDADRNTHGNIPQHMDIDVIDKLTSQGLDALAPPMKTLEAPTEKEWTEADISKLVGVVPKRVNPQDRELPTGSEVDAIMREEP